MVDLVVALCFAPGREAGIVLLIMSSLYTCRLLDLPMRHMVCRM